TATSYEWDPLEYRAAVQRDAAVKARLLEMALAQQNAMVQRFNQCVFDVLSMATGATVPRTSESWWQWWNAYNEVFVPEYKPLRTAYKRDGRDVLVGEARTRSYDVVSVNTSCLAAGTPVWTESGPSPIEKVKVGDQVLSQDVETGELAYKPVLKTTVRPPVQLMKFDAGGEAIVCTGGHPFWVCGDGWVMSRRLMPGARFHGVTGSTKIDSVEPAGKGLAFNLVVADFHTYFVGDAKILSHDNTIRKPADVLVPGLADR
ncbi:MAG: polymorphic toxin-type HINT domain-containing protein, partial [Planctomycetota bacterium]